MPFYRGWRTDVRFGSVAALSTIGQERTFS